MRRSMYEVLEEASKVTPRAKRIEYLRAKCDAGIQILLKHCYHPNIVFALPDGDPPYKPNEFLDQYGRLYSEVRKLYLFVEGGNTSLTKVRREALFIQLLESIEPNDAKLLLAVKDKKLPWRTLSKDVIMKAFPNLFN